MTIEYCNYNAGRVILVPTLVCFGDNFTAKEKESNGKLRLTSRIREKMSHWVVINAGIPNGTSRDGLQRFQEDVLFHDPDIVTIFFGTNDASNEQKVAITEFNTNLNYMIQKIRPQNTILISPFPVQDKQSFTFQVETVEQYAEETEKIAKETGCHFIDLRLIAGRPYVLSSDGITIGERGYKMLADEVMIQMKKIAKRKKLQTH